MKIDRRVTNGLAWAGVLLVVGVPTADLVSAQFMGDRPSVQAAQVAAAPQVAAVQRVAPIPAPLSQRPTAPAVQVAVATPAKPVAAPVVTPAPAKPVEQVAVATPAKPVVATPSQSTTQTASAVNSWLNSGKPLPSYITDESAPAQVAATPARTPIVTAPTAPAAPDAIDPIQVASIPQSKVAPVPMPLSMRPHPVTSVPVAIVQPEQPLIINTPGVAPRPPANITEADLADWESGPLSEFLAQRQGQAAPQRDPAYDDDGFFLDEGPNGRQRDRLVGPADTYYFPFVN